MTRHDPTSRSLAADIPLTEFHEWLRVSHSFTTANLYTRVVRKILDIAAKAGIDVTMDAAATGLVGSPVRESPNPLVPVMARLSFTDAGLSSTAWSKFARYCMEGSIEIWPHPAWTKRTRKILPPAAAKGVSLLAGERKYAMSYDAITHTRWADVDIDAGAGVVALYDRHYVGADFEVLAEALVALWSYAVGDDVLLTSKRIKEYGAIPLVPVWRRSQRPASASTLRRAARWASVAGAEVPHAD